MSELTDGVTDQQINLYLWCAGVVHTNRPLELQEEVVATPLRSAPSVTREVRERLDEWSGEVRDYSDSGLPAPGDWPSVIQLQHRGHRRISEHPVDCDQCGRDVAAQLRELGVGAEGECIR